MFHNDVDADPTKILSGTIVEYSMELREIKLEGYFDSENPGNWSKRWINFERVVVENGVGMDGGKDGCVSKDKDSDPPVTTSGSGCCKKRKVGGASGARVVGGEGTEVVGGGEVQGYSSYVASYGSVGGQAGGQVEGGAAGGPAGGAGAANIEQTQLLAQGSDDGERRNCPSRLFNVLWTAPVNWVKSIVGTGPAGDEGTAPADRSIGTGIGANTDSSSTTADSGDTAGEPEPSSDVEEEFPELDTFSLDKFDLSNLTVDLSNLNPGSTDSVMDDSGSAQYIGNTSATCPANSSNLYSRKERKHLSEHVLQQLDRNRSVPVSGDQSGIVNSVPTLSFDLVEIDWATLKSTPSTSPVELDSPNPTLDSFFALLRALKLPWGAPILIRGGATNFERHVSREWFLSYAQSKRNDIQDIFIGNPLFFVGVH